MAGKQRMGEVLVELGLIDEHKLRHALEVSKREGLKLGETLIRLGYLGEDQVLDILGNLTGVLTLNMRTWSVRKHAQTLLSRDRMMEMKAIPLSAAGRKAVVAFADPLNYVAVEKVKLLLDRDVTPVLASLSQIEDILTHLDATGYGAKSLPLTKVRRTFAHVTIRDMGLKELLKLLDDPGCTSLHLSIGTSPAVRIGKDFRRCTLPLLTATAMERLLREAVPEGEMDLLKEHKEIEYTFAKAGQGRYRVNVYHQKGGDLSMLIKKLVEDIPTISALGLPPMLISMLEKRGLILVSSARGQGKDTTIAALVNHINSTRNANIVTFEDPIEYIHHHKLSNVNQRELGHDTHKDIPDVFEKAIRLDPDMLVLTNLKDTFMMDTAALAAHKGILVIAGMSAIDVFSAIEQFVSSLSSDYMKGLFSRTLLGSFSQRLVWSNQKKRMVLVWEGMLATPRIQKYIRDDKVYFIKSQAPSLRGEYFPLEESVAEAIKTDRLDHDSVRSEPWINQETLKVLLER
ncbi:MAG: Flp pilus assembly complex ATPase component TadA [Desulfobacterota bacterium]|jgi:twitching motility protein PilT|nr:Flp pilus assembly complex ATPase component TadA [Thermodesulfobacteriota bacterium]